MNDVTSALEAVDEQRLTRLGFRGEDIPDTLQARDTALASAPAVAEVERLSSVLIADIGAVGKKDAFSSATSAGGLGADVLAVLACLVAADTVADVLAREVGADVAWRSLADLGQQVWVHRVTDGSFGCGTYWWLAVVYSGVFAHLGRLQFNLDRVDGQVVVSTHIPQSGPLTPDAVADAFAQAKEVFGTRFGNATGECPPICCDSWLLDPDLAAALPPQSNMARFQACWQVSGPGREADDSVLFFAFRRRPPIVVSDLPTETRLHQVLVARWAEGGHWHSCLGFLRS